MELKQKIEGSYIKKMNLVRVQELIQGQKGQETIANSQKIQIFVG